MEFNLPILIAMEDKTSASKLRESIQKIFPKTVVYQAKDGEKAWEFLETPPSKPVILTEFKLPKMSIFQLVKQLRENEILKNTYVIVLSSTDNPDEMVKALQAGADDFIPKPYTIDKLISRLRAATRIVSSQKEIEDLNTDNSIAQKKLRQDITAFNEMLDIFMRNKFEEQENQLYQVRAASNWIAKQMPGITSAELANIDLAAKLAYIGKLSIPDKMINDPVMKKGYISNKEMEKIPFFAKDVVSKIRDYDEVVNILYHIYENFDGSGHPDKIKAWQIPLGSRIIRVAMDFEEAYKASFEKEGKAIETIYHERNRLYDFKIVTLYEQFLANPENPRFLGNDIKMFLHELKEGMVLSRNIITESGLIVMSAGLVLTEENIIKIEEILRSDPMIGSIFVRAQKRFY